jgi:hypothetical protein
MTATLPERSFDVDAVLRKWGFVLFDSKICTPALEKVMRGVWFGTLDCVNHAVRPEDAFRFATLLLMRN